MTIVQTNSRRGLNTHTLTEDTPKSLVDTVAITFAIDTAPRDCEGILNLVPDGAWFVGGPKLNLPQGANFSIQKRTRTGRIQCSVPKVQFGHNRHGASASDVVPAFERLLTDAERHGFTARLSEVSDADISRIDVCRDFPNSQEAPNLMSSLAKVPQRWGAKAALYRDSAGRPQTLEVRTDYAWGAKLYMKDEEDTDAGAGLLRFEGEVKRSLGSAWTKMSTPIKRLSDVSDDHLEVLGRRVFKRACFDTPTRDIDSLVDAVLGLDETKEAKQKILANCIALDHDRGLDWIGGHDKTLRKMARKVRRVGLLADGMPGSLRLDWERGLVRD